MSDTQAETQTEAQAPLLAEALDATKRGRMAGAWLRRERLALGWTQEQFAEQIQEGGAKGPVSNTVARWERGEMRPATSYIPHIARVIGVDARLVAAILRFLEVERIPDDF